MTSPGCSYIGLCDERRRLPVVTAGPSGPPARSAGVGLLNGVSTFLTASRPAIKRRHLEHSWRVSNSPRSVQGGARFLSISHLKEIPSLGGQRGGLLLDISSNSNCHSFNRPALCSALAATEIALNGRLARSAISTRSCSPSERLSTHSIASCASLVSLRPPSES